MGNSGGEFVRLLPSYLQDTEEEVCFRNFYSQLFS